MNKLLLAVLMLGGGAISFAALRRSAERAEAARLSYNAELNATTNRLAESNRTRGSLRDAVKDNKNRLSQVSSLPSVRPELLELAQSKAFDPHASSRAALRHEFSIGSHNSPHSL